MIVAIDGPAGAGKSTISKLLAEATGFTRLDTGALYRAVGLAATRAKIAVDDPGLGAFVEALSLQIDGDRLVLDGEDVSAAIRTPEAGTAASIYAAIPAVRDGLMGLQRRIGHAQDSILDGRDIGTVVFPDAEVKIFLTASAEERARRRHAELQGRGAASDFATVLAEIEARDHQDRSRAIAPLKQAADAHLVDATTLTIAEAVEACAGLIRAAQAHGVGG